MMSELETVIWVPELNDSTSAGVGIAVCNVEETSTVMGDEVASTAPIVDASAVGTGLALETIAVDAGS